MCACMQASELAGLILSACLPGIGKFNRSARRVQNVQVPLALLLFIFSVCMLPLGIPAIHTLKILIKIHYKE